MADNFSRTTSGPTQYLRTTSFWVLGIIGFSAGGILSFKYLRESNPGMTFFDCLGEMLFFGLLLSMLLWLVRLLVMGLQLADKSDIKIEALEKKAEEEPDKARPAWDLARVKLEAYFDRNLLQVKMIFYVAVLVMLAGFGFILWGLHAAVINPAQVKLALIASASGVITQFIGLTFMVIYKSTMLQATQFMSVLERINTVGMAVGILDPIKDENGELKDTTRVDIIRLLLATPSVQMSFTPRKRKAKLNNGTP
jgi:putative ubiquitin-RnfH superfamily antitoxin RatB of RatAB toxin-antitoxin module